MSDVLCLWADVRHAGPPSALPADLLTAVQQRGPDLDRWRLRPGASVEDAARFVAWRATHTTTVRIAAEPTARVAAAWLARRQVVLPLTASSTLDEAAITALWAHAAEVLPAQGELTAMCAALGEVAQLARRRHAAVTLRVAAREYPEAALAPAG